MNSSLKSSISRVGIIVIAAVMVEVISIIQYERLQSVLPEGVDMQHIRQQQMWLVLLGLAILAFMIQRYARNEKKLREASEEQARIGSELSVARRIQEEMLPKFFPADIYGSLEPAREVGGDLYDFYQRDGKLFFCIGDVSGKGVPSAMLMSVIHSLFRVLSQKTEDPSRILKELNQELCRFRDRVPGSVL